MKFLCILILPFLSGIIFEFYTQLQFLNIERKLLTGTERIEYNKAIENWIPPIVIPEFKEPAGGWENRINR